MGRQLTDAYYSSVRTSFASKRPTMVDRDMGIDHAFMVCRTEGSKLQAFESLLRFWSMRRAALSLRFGCTPAYQAPPKTVGAKEPSMEGENFFPSSHGLPKANFWED
jgi:hypothetical protein